MKNVGHEDTIGGRLESVKVMPEFVWPKSLPVYKVLLIHRMSYFGYLIHGDIHYRLNAIGDDLAGIHKFTRSGDDFKTHIPGRYFVQVFRRLEKSPGFIKA